VPNNLGDFRKILGNSAGEPLMQRAPAKTQDFTEQTGGLKRLRATGHGARADTKCRSPRAWGMAGEREVTISPRFEIGQCPDTR